MKKTKIPQIRQDLYKFIIRQGFKEDANHPYIESGSIVLTFEDQSTVTVDKQPLLDTVFALNVPIENLKTIEATLLKIGPANWRSFEIMTEGGTVVTRLTQKMRSLFPSGSAYFNEDTKNWLDQRKVESFR